MNVIASFTAIGRLAKNPAIKTTQRTGKEMANILLQSDDGNHLEILCFGLCLDAVRTLSEGTLIAVTGSLSGRANQTASGGTFYNTAIIANKISPLEEFISTRERVETPPQDSGDLPF